MYSYGAQNMPSVMNVLLVLIFALSKCNRSRNGIASLESGQILESRSFLTFVQLIL